jgi:hypothetical protein
LEDSKGLYDITLLKREPRDFSSREIAREIERGHQIRDLYGLAHAFLPHLDISNESIKYYASLVAYYSVFRLKQLDEWVVYLYLLCFVYHRYQKLHDNLLNTLIHHVRRYADEAKGEAKERVYEHRMEGNDNLLKAGQLLKLFTDDSIAESTPFLSVVSPIPLSGIGIPLMRTDTDGSCRIAMSFWSIVSSAMLLKPVIFFAETACAFAVLRMTCWMISDGRTRTR